MKKMNKETAYNLKTIFGSLISNNSALEAGKMFPLWAALIVFLLGVFLPVIPTMVSTSNSRGSNYVNTTYNYSFDKEMTGAFLSIYNEGQDFVFNENKQLEPVLPILTSEEYPIASYVNSLTGQHDLEVFYCTNDVDEGVNALFKKVVERSFLRGTYTPKSDADPEGQLYYSPSVIFLHKKGMAVYIFQHNSTTPISNTNNYGGDWGNTDPNTKLIERVLSVTDYNIPTSLNDPTLVRADKYIKGVFENFKGVMDEGYINTKNRTLLLTTFIYLGVYAGLTLLLGLLIFLLTRGKKNMNRYLTFIQCEKITAWTTIAPGILSLALGFAIPNFAVMFFILFEGMRVMWLSMKQLSPAYQA